VPEPAQASPISTTDLWSLDASPQTLTEAAGAWRGLQEAATSAQGTVDAAAYQVLGEEAWTGQAADAYDEHRTKLTGDIGELAAWAGSIADALDSLAWTLQSAQNQLTEIRAALPVPAVRQGDQLIFQPADADQAAAVTEAIAAANAIRSGLDEELVMKEAAFDTTLPDIVALKDSWREQTVRLVNLNIGSGHDNLNFGDKSGVAPEEVDDLAARLVRENADIATLQEVFEEDLGTLEAELEERTGEEWNVHFTEASTKPRFTSPLDVLDTVFWGGPDNNINEPFGNAVLVREGDQIAGSDTVDDHIKLDAEGSVVREAPPPSSPTPGTTTTTSTVPGTPVPPDTQILDDEGRAAIQVEVTFRDDG
jgi:hypothetical protein